MLTVDDYGRIRRAHRDGMSIRAIARTFHHSRRKIREVLQTPEPRPYTRTRPPHAPKLGPFHSIIDEILRADEQAPPKQRHTAMQVHRRLVTEHGYRGGYDAVRRYIGKRRKRQRPTFIPLSHEAGQRGESDFGHIHVDFPDGRRQVPVLLVAWSYSHAPFAMAMATERIEAVLEGMVSAFEFFGCVPREVWWDNPKTVATAILKGRERRVHPRYAALASHYRFDPMFCMPASGWEKPRVENRVFDLQRRWGTPVPAVRDLDELNALLRAQCLAEHGRTVRGRTETIGERFEHDRAAALALPEHPFDPSIEQPAKVDKYQTIRFQTNHYSVPRAFAFGMATVRASVDRVNIVVGDAVVASHRRSYGRGEQILDPLHYLVTLGRRPAALDHAGVYRNWRLPSVFAELRGRLERRDGPTAGARQYIRVLQLLAEHPQERVRKALEALLAREIVDVERIRRHVERLATTTSPMPADGHALDDTRSVPRIEVPMPDLGHFDHLLTSTRNGDLVHA
jgi:transposase